MSYPAPRIIWDRSGAFFPNISPHISSLEYEIKADGPFTFFHEPAEYDGRSAYAVAIVNFIVH